jgi:hypothetical protein
MISDGQDLAWVSIKTDGLTYYFNDPQLGGNGRTRWSKPQVPNKRVSWVKVWDEESNREYFYSDPRKGGNGMTSWYEPLSSAYQVWTTLAPLRTEKKDTAAPVHVNSIQIGIISPLRICTSFARSTPTVGNFLKNLLSTTELTITTSRHKSQKLGETLRNIFRNFRRFVELVFRIKSLYSCEVFFALFKHIDEDLLGYICILSRNVLQACALEANIYLLQQRLKFIRKHLNCRHERKKYAELCTKCN